MVSDLRCDTAETHRAGDVEHLALVAELPRAEARPGRRVAGNALRHLAKFPMNKKEWMFMFSQGFLRNLGRISSNPESCVQAYHRTLSRVGFTELLHTNPQTSSTTRKYSKLCFRPQAEKVCHGGPSILRGTEAKRGGTWQNKAYPERGSQALRPDSRPRSTPPGPSSSPRRTSRCPP